MEPVYDLNYFFTYRDKCNQQWKTVRDGVFDRANRSNLAEIIYWPYSCNEKLWFHEASNNLRPPREFDFKNINTLGGIFDMGHVELPAQRYTVTNDILIKPHSKLTLRPGTELNFLNGVGMLVLGEIAIEGVQSSPVKFSLANQKTANSARYDQVRERIKKFFSSTMRMPVLGLNNLTGSVNATNSTSFDDLEIEYSKFERKGMANIQLEGGRDIYEGELTILKI